MLIVIIVNTTIFLLDEEVWHNDGFVFRRNPVEFNQSDDDFKTPKVFPIF